MKFSDIFRGSSSQSAPPAQPQTAPQTPPEPPPAEVSPMESFKDFWQTEASETTEDSTDLGSIFNIDPEKVNSTVANLDFTKSLDPQVLESISAGGEEATKAFFNSLNAVARDVFSQSMLANGMLVKQALTKAQDKIDTRTSQSYNRLKASEAITSSNPMFKDPAVAPLVAAVQEQFHRKYPNADSEVIRAQAEKYLLSVADVIRGPSEKQKAAESSAKETDFSTFLDFN